VVKVEAFFKPSFMLCIAFRVDANCSAEHPVSNPIETKNVITFALWNIASPHISE
jgi:hypothetical protein